MLIWVVITGGFFLVGFLVGMQISHRNSKYYHKLWKETQGWLEEERIKSGIIVQADEREAEDNDPISPKARESWTFQERFDFEVSHMQYGHEPSDTLVGLTPHQIERMLKYRYIYNFD